MTSKRRYDDSCGMAQGLNVVGDRWALHVVRELLLGPKRFADLRADLPGISSNVLTQRLTELEEHGVVHHRRLPAPAATWVYELTEWGAHLEPIIIQLGSWAARSPKFDRSAPVSCASAVLAMRTMFQPGTAHTVPVRIGFHLADQTVLAQTTGTALDIVRVESLGATGGDELPDAVVTTTPKVLIQLIFREADLDGALETGLVALEGDRAAFERYLACFPLADPAPAPSTT